MATLHASTPRVLASELFPASWESLPVLPGDFPAGSGRRLIFSGGFPAGSVMLSMKEERTKHQRRYDALPRPARLRLGRAETMAMSALAQAIYAGVCARVRLCARCEAKHDRRNIVLTEPRSHAARNLPILAGAMATLLVGTPARADEPTNGPGWAFGSWGGEIAFVTVGLGALAAGHFLPQRQSTLGPDMPHPASTAPNTWSYATAFGAPLLIGGAAYYFEGALRSGTGSGSVNAPYAHAWMPLLIESESMALAGGMTELLKHAVGRCRPRAWHNGKCDGTDEDNLAAFPSGHTSFASAFAGARLVFAIRSKGTHLTALRWIAFGLTEVAAMATATLRVNAGAHSVSDVIGGWAIGHAAGVSVALMHPMVSRIRIGFLTVGPTSVNWSGSF